MLQRAARGGLALRRAMHATRCAAAEAPGVPAGGKGGRLGGLADLDVLQDEPQSEQRVTIDAIGDESFTINGLHLRGSVFLFRYFTTLWNVSSVEDLTASAFVLPKLLLPRPDIILVGTGRNSKPLSPELLQFFSSVDINVDVMDTKNACHTFNVLNQEGRNVAAGLMPQNVEH